MEGINREYATRVHNYIRTMVYFEELLNKSEITIKVYIEIECKNSLQIQNGGKHLQNGKKSM